MFAWYDNADRKAQLILTANGGLLTILTGLALTKPSNTGATVDTFGPETWVFAGLTAASILTAFAAASLALWSRLLSDRDARAITEGHRTGDGVYDPAVLWFFQLVQHLDETAFEQRLRAFTAEDEIDALADGTLQLAQRVTLKHRWVNVGFFATAATLSCLLATAVSYAIRIAS